MLAVGARVWMTIFQIIIANAPQPQGERAATAG
jgi:hypothetical protein